MTGGFPPGIPDEQLLLRATMPADQVDAMLAAGPARRHYDPNVKPVLDPLRELRARPALSDIVVDKPGFRLSLRADSAEGGRG